MRIAMISNTHVNFQCHHGILILLPKLKCSSVSTTCMLPETNPCQPYTLLVSKALKPEKQVGGIPHSQAPPSFPPLAVRKTKFSLAALMSFSSSMIHHFKCSRSALTSTSAVLYNLPRHFLPLSVRPQWKSPLLLSLPAPVGPSQDSTPSSLSSVTPTLQLWLWPAAVTCPQSGYGPAQHACQM